MNEQQFNATASGQQQLRANAAANAARADETFLALVESGMTKRDLAMCIKNRPSIWEKYSHWMVKLPA